ncbi:hypothetical protein [Methylobacterium nodulans]|uniref:hypothetical protein n=1 Tax=Methylobacterium nodulans TaxID=114616 RepID=UPI0012EDEC24|nr:hypothetical protein [Methylobacterium nodulans]
MNMRDEDGPVVARWITNPPSKPGIVSRNGAQRDFASIGDALVFIAGLPAEQRQTVMIDCQGKTLQGNALEERISRIAAR